MGRKPKTAADTPEPKPTAVTRRSTRRGRSGRSDSESEEPIGAPAPNYCEDDSASEDDYSPSKKAAKRGGRRGRGSRAGASSGSDREAAVRTPKARGGGRGRRGGSVLSASPVTAKELSVVLESSVVVAEEEPVESQEAAATGMKVTFIDFVFRF